MVAPPGTGQRLIQSAGAAIQGSQVVRALRGQQLVAGTEALQNGVGKLRPALAVRVTALSVTDDPDQLIGRLDRHLVVSRGLAAPDRFLVGPLGAPELAIEILQPAELRERLGDYRLISRRWRAASVVVRIRSSACL